MKTLASGQLGSVGSYALNQSDDGKLSLSVCISDGPLSASVSAAVSEKALLDSVAGLVAAKTGSAIPTEVASFLEKAFGIA